ATGRPWNGRSRLKPLLQGGGGAGEAVGDGGQGGDAFGLESRFVGEDVATLEQLDLPVWCEAGLHLRLIDREWWPGLFRRRIFERDQQAAAARRQPPPGGARIGRAHLRWQGHHRAAVVDAGAVR